MLCVDAILSSSLVQTAGFLFGTQIAWEGAAKGGMSRWAKSWVLKGGAHPRQGKTHTVVRDERISLCWSLMPEGLGADGQVHSLELESTILHPLEPLLVHPSWFEYDKDATLQSIRWVERQARKKVQPGEITCCDCEGGRQHLPQLCGSRKAAWRRGLSPEPQERGMVGVKAGGDVPFWAQGT